MRMIRVEAATFRFGQTEIPGLRQDSAFATRETRRCLRVSCFHVRTKSCRTHASNRRSRVAIVRFCGAAMERT